MLSAECVGVGLLSLVCTDVWDQPANDTNRIISLFPSSSINSVQLAFTYFYIITERSQSYSHCLILKHMVDIDLSHSTFQFDSPNYEQTI